jgi:integrase
MARPRRPTIALPPYVKRNVSRGKEYFTYQRGRGTEDAGPRIKLPHLWDDGFSSAYRAASGESEPPIRRGTFSALVTEFRSSPEWHRLSPAAKRDYQRYSNDLVRILGSQLVSDLQPKHVLAIRDKRQTTPAAANYLVRVLSLLISWSIPRGYRADNPCRHVPRLKTGEGWAAWSWDAICEFRELAVAPMWHAASLALYTGQRQGDLLAMNWASIDQGTIEVRQGKTGKTVWVPVHRDLQEVLAAVPRRSVKVLTTLDGRPWTVEGFRSQWSDQMHCIGLMTGTFEGLVFHGLRKSAVCFLLEVGCSAAEVGAITGQSLQMVEHYARMRDTRKLAASAMLRWENASETGIGQRSR